MPIALLLLAVRLGTLLARGRGYVEGGLRHLHELALVLDLPLRQLEVVSRHRVAGCVLLHRSGLLVVHDQVLLSLLAAEVGVGRGGLVEVRVVGLRLHGHHYQVFVRGHRVAVVVHRPALYAADVRV